MPKEPKKHIHLRNDQENKELLLADTDLWGIQNALQHAIQTGYAKDNEAWHEYMVNAISDMRDSMPEEEFEPV